MENLYYVEPQNLPERLYHYTSIDGIEGILKERALWATQIHFLNDTQEFKYSLGILRKVLGDLIKEYQKIPPCAISNSKEALAYLYNTIMDMILIQSNDKFRIFVFSFSKRDLLSQWRGYCPPGGGYSIGFRSDLLIKLLGDFPYKLTIESCIYDEKRQEAKIKLLLDKTSETYIAHWSESPNQIEKARITNLVTFFQDFSQLAATLKHPAFHEECEWRIVSNLIPIESVLFRKRKSILLPYLPIYFKDTDFFPIDEIVIGPSPEQELARLSLNEFLTKNNINVSINTSLTPYREF